MHVTNLKTFIAVTETGSFVGAAERVHVTQSTVSVRIRVLEDYLGVYLFDRGKKGAVLTIDGQKFLKTAVAIVNLWGQARIEIGLSASQESILRVGAQVSLWDGFMTTWLSSFKSANPNIALRAEMASSTDLIERLTNAELDVIVLYRPQYRPGYEAQIIFDEELILVSTVKHDPEPLGQNYIFMYWGPDFQADHSLNFPDIPVPEITMDIGTLGLEYIFEHGGSAYLPKRIVKKYLKEKRLYIVKDQPTFKYPVYLLYSHTLDEQLVSKIKCSM